jgi:hypothetical protein
MTQTKSEECELCDGKGFFLSNSDKYGERIEKCDSCAIFETDEKAQKHNTHNTLKP